MAQRMMETLRPLLDMDLGVVAPGEDKGDPSGGQGPTGQPPMVAVATEVVIEQFNVNEDGAGRWMANLLLRKRGPGRAFDRLAWLTDPDGYRIPTPCVAPRTSRSRSGRGGLS